MSRLFLFCTLVFCVVGNVFVGDTDERVVVQFEEEFQPLVVGKGGRVVEITAGEDELMTKYVCVLPTPRHLRPAGHSVSDYEISQSPTPHKRDVVHAHSHLRQMLDEKKCITIASGGWFHHEFCPFRYVRQFHVNEQGKMDTEIYLGYYSEEKSLKEQNMQQIYTDGTVCDITGTKREARVNLHCWKTDEKKAGMFFTVTEPATCVYEIDFFSTSLCELPESVEDSRQKHDTTVGRIVCNAVVD